MQLFDDAAMLLANVDGTTRAVLVYDREHPVRIAYASDATIDAFTAEVVCWLEDEGYLTLDQIRYARTQEATW